MTPNEQAIQYAYDAYNADMLRRFYAARAEAILSSGDDVRIRLYEAWRQSIEQREKAA